MKTLLFDVDGVLCDTEQLHRQALSTAAAVYGYIIPDNDTSTTLDKLRVAEVPSNKVHLIYTFKRLLFEEQIPNIKPSFPLAAALYTLYGRGFKMAACTNSNHGSTTKLLTHLGISGVFATLVAASDVEKGKPAPDIYLAAMSQLAVTPSEVTVFEDSDVSIEAALRAGVTNIIRCTTETLLKELEPWLQ